MPEIDLSGLRDLHLLSKPSLWPLATGWWVVLATLLIITIICIVWAHLRRQRPDIYAVRKAKKMAQNIPDDLDYLKNISQLLKRVGIVLYGRPQIAPLSDSKWQEFLTKQAPDTFTEKEAHLIAFAPYEQKLKTKLNREQFTQHVALWIKKVFKNKKSS